MLVDLRRQQGYNILAVEKLVSRRGFFRVSRGLTYAGAATVATEALAVRKVQNNHPITAEVLENLQQLSERIALHIKGAEFGTIVEVQGSPLSSGERIDLNFVREPFAQTIIRLAFLDGGENEAHEVADFIAAHGLEIVFDERERSPLLGETIARVIPPLKISDPVRLKISPRVLLDASLVPINDPTYSDWVEEKMVHELCHVIQSVRLAKNPHPFISNMSLATSELTIPLIASAGIVYLTKIDPLTRRGVFATFATILGSSLMTKFLETRGILDFSILERQANYLSQVLMQSTAYDPIRGRLLSFQMNRTR